ncbi:hypothetical protein QTP70_011358 [Hemibagrus guttatus]|uniref:Ubiquitin carboxyl-terminal hydrolase n=1 Tax=Hemibagrus guttatus TaxID=175788 RepID=A0AAE0V6P7_9TELE|nr:hypothetical protein QTP70_011358 [Hemibagrus guttatus]
MDPYMSYYGYQEPRSNVQERSAGQRYNGLRNQGATCYLNSVLQCLYMTEDFRKEVENFVPIQINSDEERLVQELQKLFVNMKECVCSTEGITQCLGITNVYKEEDVVEYYQKILKAIGPQLSKVFEGKMSNKTKCLNDHIFEEKCHFFTIPLAIKAEHSEVFNVLNGLNTFSEPVKLDEDNWLYCKDCGQKNETQTWNEIEEFPTILTLYPKRFYFDYNQMRPVKNHCPMDFPLHLLIRNNEYELYAVINHIGSEYGGHYNAVIKSFEDDKCVFQDPSNFKGSISSMKAYLLMYRRCKELLPNASEGRKQHPRAIEGREQHPRAIEGREQHPRASEGREQHPWAREGAQQHPQPSEGAEHHTQVSESTEHHNQASESTKLHPRSNEGAEQHPCVSEGAEHHTQASESTKLHPRVSEGTEQRPRASKGAEQHPRPSEGTEHHTQASEGAEHHTQASESTKLHPRASEGAEQHPRSSEGAEQHPQMSEGVKQHPRVRESTKLHQWGWRWVLTGHRFPSRRVRWLEEGHMEGVAYAIRCREPETIRHRVYLADGLEQPDKFGAELPAG